MIAQGRLRLVTDDRVGEELERRHALQGEMIRTRTRPQAPELACQGMFHTWDGPDGNPLPLGGFDLVCTYTKGHGGYCHDETGITFTPKVDAVIPEKHRRSGCVVHWGGHDWRAIRDLERELADHSL